MRLVVLLGVFAFVANPASGQNREPPPPPRYGVDADLDVFPQDSPKAALASVVKAIDARRYSYLAAQLADPDEVDKRLGQLGGKFDNYVRQVTERLTSDPEVVRQLRRLSAEGEFNVNGDAATVSHKQIPGRQVFLRKVGSRW
ncbi:MAG TPA: hypothetical protein VH120_17010, partial [Gemmataceae bacterium]|nr:hypothetical protein [Gemmataceae bacterium]